MDSLERRRRVSSGSAEARIKDFGRIDLSADPDHAEIVDFGSVRASRLALDQGRLSPLLAIVRAMRPTQWIKNGVLLAGLVFGGKLTDPTAVASALYAVVCFCLLSSGFYLLNDVRDAAADRQHPQKRLRPVASGALSSQTALRVAVGLVGVALAASLKLGPNFLLATLAYAGLMAAYNLGLKQIVIIDVMVIAIGFVIRAAAGAIAVHVSVSPWLLICTLVLAMLIGFGKRRHELLVLEVAVLHRRNLESYSRQMLDQAVAITATATLVAYAVYTFEADTAPRDLRMMVTIPLVAYGVFRYLHILYRQGGGGAPETLLLTDRSLLTVILLWGIVCVGIAYFA
jgi:4-hydroxybenzoate polyprenyltransferase